MTWQSKAKAAMRQSGITQEKLAEELGISQGGLSHWLNGRREPELDMLEKIAGKLGFTLSEFLEVGGMKVESFPRPASSEDFAIIPQYDVLGSCGNGFANGEHLEVKKGLAFHRAWLKEEGLYEKHLSVITAHGDSMSPTISDGAILLINDQYGRLETGKVYALLNGDEVRVKRLFGGFSGEWRIASDNPNKTLYPDDFVSADALDSLKIIGRVVWTGGKL